MGILAAYPGKIPGDPFLSFFRIYLNGLPRKNEIACHLLSPRGEGTNVIVLFLLENLQTFLLGSLCAKKNSLLHSFTSENRIQRPHWGVGVVLSKNCGEVAPFRLMVKQFDTP